MQNTNTRQDLREWAHKQPERLALVTEKRSWTYQELESAANRLAHTFKSKGLQHGDHVAGLLLNGPFSFVMAWAAYRSGLYFTPIPTTLTAAEVAYIVNNSQAKLVVVGHPFSDIAVTLPTLADHAVEWLSIDGSIAGFQSVEDVMSTSPEIPRTDEMPGNLMFYTSGTTGRPKGVWRPLLPKYHSGPPPFAADLLTLFDLKSDTRYLSPAPLYHAAPLRFSLAVTAAGGTVFVMDKFNAAKALDMIQSMRITHSQWVPTMFQRMLQLPQELRDKFHAPNHRLALHSAAPCPIPVKRAMIDWWGPILLEYYSGSEGVGLTSIDSHEWADKPGSVGRAKKGTIHVLDENDVEVGADQIGRIYFSGVSPFQYFQDPEKTAARTSPQGYQTLGEVGYVDQEGYLFLTDRLDDMIISGGVNIYPQEIECAIMEIPEVIDVGVVGAAHPDFGECPVAYIVPRQGMKEQEEVLRETVKNYCAEHLGRIKQPAAIHIVDELPRSATGKLLRRILRSQKT